MRARTSLGLMLFALLASIVNDSSGNSTSAAPSTSVVDTSTSTPTTSTTTTASTTATSTTTTSTTTPTVTTMASTTTKTTTTTSLTLLSEQSTSKDGSEKATHPSSTGTTTASSIGVQSPTTTKKRSSRIGVGTVIMLVLAVLFIIVILCCAGFLFFGYQRHFQRDMYCDQVTSTKEPLDALRKLTHAKGAVDSRGLKKETAKIEIAQQNRRFGKPSTDMLRYLHMIPDAAKEKADQKRGVVAKVPSCRYPKRLIRKDTQVILAEKRDCLHMNRLFDYYGEPLLLCQAPTPSQFVDHWMAIWQEKVGVVVWLGPLEEKGKSKIDPYIPLETPKSLTCGPFFIQNNGVVIASQKEYYTYLVSVTRGSEKRELEVVHISMWPDDVMPSAEDIGRLADAIGYVRVQQRLKSKETPNSLPVLLAHCSLGLQSSPGFLAAYIGNQMWIDARRLNVLGIFQFIRRYRWKGFGLGESDLQVRVVYRILEIIATRYADAVGVVCAIKLSPKTRRKKALTQPKAAVSPV